MARVKQYVRKGKIVRSHFKLQRPGVKLSVNRTGNARAGKRFATSKDSKGRNVHVYNVGGKRVAVVVKKKADQNRKRMSGLSKGGMVRKGR